MEKIKLKNKNKKKNQSKIIMKKNQINSIFIFLLLDIKCKMKNYKMNNMFLIPQKFQKTQ